MREGTLHPGGTREAAIVALVFVVLAVVWGASSTAFQEADDVTHYSFSRWIFDVPEKVVDIWGRPVITLFYALPAQFGPTAARLASVVLGIATAWSAARIFRSGGGRQEALAVACTLGMPFVFFQMYGILTEIGCATVLGIGFALYRDRKPRAAAVVWSLLPLTRPEGFVLVPVFGLALLLARSAHPSPALSLRRFSCAALLLAGTGAWWLAGLPIYRSARWMIEEWPRNWRPDSVYGDGPPLLFLAFVVLVVTRVLFPFFVIGAVRFWRARLRLEVVTIGVVVVLHSILRTFGLFGSAGYPRYLVTVAPLLGALAADGLEVFVGAWASSIRGLAARWVRPAAAAALVLVLVSTILLWPQAGPVRGDSDVQMLRRILPWCQKQLASHPDMRFVADHPFFFVAADLDGKRHGLPFRRHVVEYAEIGTVAIWETKFSGRYSDLKNKADLVALGFEPVPKEDVAGRGPYPWEGPRPAGGEPELENFDFEVFVKKR